MQSLLSPACGRLYVDAFDITVSLWTASGRRVRQLRSRLILYIFSSKPRLSPCFFQSHWTRVFYKIESFFGWWDTTRWHADWGKAELFVTYGSKGEKTRNLPCRGAQGVAPGTGSQQAEAVGGSRYMGKPSGFWSLPGDWHILIIPWAPGLRGCP